MLHTRHVVTLTSQSLFGGLLLLFAFCSFSSRGFAETATSIIAKNPAKKAARSWTLGLRTPAISPDGQKVAFSVQGDIWIVGIDGREPRRLTSHLAYDFRPRWSPDGRHLLFTSRRTGGSDVYVIPATGGAPHRVTYHSANDVGLDWSPDGKRILFESDRESLRTLFVISRAGGMPTRLLRGYWNMAHSGAWSPDGKTILFGQSYEGLSYWWRKGYKGPNNADILSFRLWPDTGLAVVPKVRSLTTHQKNDVWPMWSNDGKSFYFVSERDGVANIWRGSPGGGRKEQITKFKKGPVRWPSIARAVPLIVYERNFRLWLTDLKSGQSRPIAIELKASSPHPLRRWKTVKKLSEYAISPDGKKLALVMHGEVYVTDAKLKTSVHRVTKTSWREQNVAWAKDSRHLIYTSERGAGFVLIRRMPLAQKEEILYRAKKAIHFPSFSPDGKSVAFVEGTTSLKIWSEGKGVRLLAERQLVGDFGWAPQWSPDSRWLMVVEFSRGRGDLWALRVDKQRAVRLTPTAAHDADGVFSSDGKYVYFRSNRYGSDWFTHVGGDDLYVMPLLPQKLQFPEQRLEALFKAPAKGKSPKSKKSGSNKGKSKDTSKSASKKKVVKKGKKKSVKVVIDGKDLLQRMRRLTRFAGNERWPKVSPDGKRLLFFADGAGHAGIWIAKIDRKKLRLKGAKPIAGSLRFPHLWGDYGLRWGPKGKSAYVVHRGVLVRISIPSGKLKRLAVRVKIEVDEKKHLWQMFREVWVTMRDSFYDPKMSGLDWSEVYKRYAKVIKQVQTRVDWQDLMNEMLGELNASHLGVRLAGSRAETSTGTLGLDWSFIDGKISIQRVLRHGAFYQAHRASGSKIKWKSAISKGGFILGAIDGKKVNAGVNIHFLLRNKIGKRVSLVFEDASGKTLGQLNVHPQHYRTERYKRYEAWVEARRQKVLRWSGGKIGYLHMRAMGNRNLIQMIRDFETRLIGKQAMVIDLRYNFGGNVHDRVLQILSRRLYSTWQIRGMRPWPQPFFAAGHLPMAMLINERSLSDAEMTANGFKALKLGKIVGVGSYRWLIFTTSRALLGGGSFRLPFWACRTLDGKDLEKVGVEPDVTVRETFQDRLLDRDIQLKTATRLLLKQIQERAAKRRKKSGGKSSKK